MKPTGFYKLTDEYISLIEKLNGIYSDRKERPIYCCVQDKKNPAIYWAIPTSGISHRLEEQLMRIKHFCSLPERDIRSCYYHIGHTNKPAIFKISSTLPAIDRYISGEYTSQGKHLVLRSQALIAAISKKLSRILLTEEKHPNKFEQHITDIYDCISGELRGNKP
jgi:hypothetical protein